MRHRRPRCAWRHSPAAPMYSETLESATRRSVSARPPRKRDSVAAPAKQQWRTAMAKWSCKLVATPNNTGTQSLRCTHVRGSAPESSVAVGRRATNRGMLSSSPPSGERTEGGGAASSTAAAPPSTAAAAPPARTDRGAVRHAPAPAPALPCCAASARSGRTRAARSSMARHSNRLASASATNAGINSASTASCVSDSVAGSAVAPNSARARA